MKILHVITSLDTGGAEMMLAKLLECDQSKQLECKVVCLLAPGPIARRIETCGIPIVSLQLSRGIPSMSAVIRLVSEIKSWRPDIIQTWLYHADLLGLIAAKIAGCGKVIWNIRNSQLDLRRYRKMTSITLWVCRWLSWLPEMIIANSKNALDYHIAIGYRPKQTLIIGNGFDIDVFRPDYLARKHIRQELQVPDNALLIGMVARFDPQKDHRTFCKAAGILLNEKPCIHFVLCGEDLTWENEELRQWIIEEGIQDSMHLLGRREDVNRINAALDIFTLSSAFGEGFPNAVGEAMACGVPCVVTDVGDAAFLVGDTGVVVPPSNPHELSSGLGLLTTMSQENMRALGGKARQRIVRNYSIESILLQYLDMYEPLLREG